MSTNIRKISAVGLYSINIETKQYDRIASVRLNDDGSMTFDGDAVLVARLRDNAIRLGSQIFIPQDREAYLAALLQRYTDPRLKAMPLKF